MAQLNPILGDIKGNSKKILHAIAEAKAQDVNLLLFSELVLCGYAPNDLLFREDFITACEQALEDIILHCGKICVVIGTVRRNSLPGKKLFNSAAVICDGKLLGYCDKRLLPTYNLFDEKRYFEPGKSSKIFSIFGKKVAIAICEDIWQHLGDEEFSYAEDPVLDLKAQNPDLLLNLSASPYHFEKIAFRQAVCIKAARTLQCPLFICCQVGANDELIFDGYSMGIDEKGEVFHIAKGFAEDVSFVDLQKPFKRQGALADPLQDLHSALVLGIRDYFAKQGLKKAVLGVSGGIDSAVVLCLAKEALGALNVLAVAMPSRYSSQESFDDAKALCDCLNIPLQTISIEAPFTTYLSLLQKPLGQLKGLTEENLQARLRGVILMAIANQEGALVLNTGNKSELAVGYCTLYGDLCGGLSVLADLCKGDVYKLAHFINKEKELIPLAIIQKAPSAELKPNQKDTDTLPPYEVLDVVIKGYVEKQMSALKIAEQFSIPQEVVEEIIVKIYRAEYKRRQAPPGLRVSKIAFTIGRQFPIVQGWR